MYFMWAWTDQHNVSASPSTFTLSSGNKKIKVRPLVCLSLCHVCPDAAAAAADDDDAGSWQPVGRDAREKAPGRHLRGKICHQAFNGCHGDRGIN